MPLPLDAKLLAEIHPTKNPGLNISKLSAGSSRKIWWVCPTGLSDHDYEAQVGNRVRGTGCPYCGGKKILPGFNDLQTLKPEVAAQWHPTKNALKVSQVGLSSQGKVWWQCKAVGHEWDSRINDRIAAKSLCPMCDGTVLSPGVNDLASQYPELAKEWHPTKNDAVLPSQITYASNKKFWWECTVCGHEWAAPPANRFRGTGCPACAGQKLVLGLNDLATVQPDLAAQWHPTKNGSKLPQDFTAGSGTNIWWECENKHEWPARIADRTGPKATGCAKCTRQKLPTGALSLLDYDPVLANEWNAVANGRSADAIASQSNLVGSWTCAKNTTHIWSTSVANRTTHNSGCPHCWQAASTSRAELELETYLESLGLTAERRNRTVLRGQELDFYLPNFGLAIEFNGLYWHSEAAGKDRSYHRRKVDAARAKSIQLLHVWEDDWSGKRDILLRHIAYRTRTLAQLQALRPDMDEKWFTAFSARKGKLTAITYRAAADFLNLNHIQGSAKGSAYYGLHDTDGDLRAVIVVERKDKDVYLISRYAAKGLIQGGFTRLLAYATRDLGATRFITFADHAISDGGLYEHNGFTKAGEVAEDYMYVVDKVRRHKFGYRLVRFRNDPELRYEPGLTELQLAELNGLTRIWDAGKTKYELMIKTA